MNGNCLILSMNGVVSCYLPPANRKYALKLNEMHNLFKDINKLRKNCDLFISGDLNYPSINWCNMLSIEETKISFLGEIEYLEVHQNVMFNTASTGTLDLIFTSNKIHETDIQTVTINWENFQTIIRSKSLST